MISKFYHYMKMKISCENEILIKNTSSEVIRAQEITFHLVSNLVQQSSSYTCFVCFFVPYICLKSSLKSLAMEKGAFFPSTISAFSLPPPPPPLLRWLTTVL